MNIFISLLPAILILIYMNYDMSKDYKYQQSIIVCFLIGMLIVLPTALIESICLPNGFLSDNIVISNVFIIAPIEELSKLIIIYFFTKKYTNTKEPSVIIALCVAGSMGIAMIENIIYVSRGGLSIGLLRAFSSVPMHASTAVILGFFGSLAKVHNKNKYWYIGFLIAITMHSVYNIYATIYNDTKFFFGIFIFSLSYMTISYILIKKAKNWTMLLQMQENIKSCSNIIINSIKNHTLH